MSTDNSSARPTRLEGIAQGLDPSGLIAVAWTGFALAAALVGLRCYVRLSETNRLHADDCWVLAALTFLGANAVLQTLQTPYLYYLVGVQRRVIPVGQGLIEEGGFYTKYEFVVIALFWTITWSVKSSFLAMYWRLFVGLPKYRAAWWFVAVFAALSYVGCWVSSVLTCHPPTRYFDFGKSMRCLCRVQILTILQGQCIKPIDVKGSMISISYSTAVDVLTDLMIMVLPIGLLPALQVNRKQKAGLAGIFMVGLIVIAAALVRLTQIVGQSRSDPVGLAVWGLVESSISVMVGSLPALKTFLGRTLQRTLQRGSAPLSSSERVAPVKVHQSSDVYDGGHFSKSWA